jgi:uncharacterized phosphosugar-binding protein
MDPTEKYYDAIKRILREIKEKEMANIKKAADLITEKIVNDEVIWAFGTGGHSIMGAMELFTRAGGLAAISPIFPPGIANIESHPNTESLVGYAEKILDYYRVKKGDLLIEINVNGINAVTIDTALECRKRGIKIIAVTSSEFSKGAAPGIPNRHPSNKNLFELADLVVDAHVPPGDAVVEIEGFDLKVSSSSTVAIAFIANSIVAEVVENLVKKGITPEVFKSGNIAGGKERNRPLHEKYYWRVKHY